MAEDNTTRIELEPLDMSQPIYMTIWQTAKRRHIDVYTGPKAVDLATKFAAAKALSAGVQVAVVGPQQLVASPPEPVTEAVLSNPFSEAT